MQPSTTTTPHTIADAIERFAAPVSSAADLGRLVDMAADKRCVMLGEASHGTHEYYRWRAQISQRLIEEHGFTFVAVEGDWPDIHRLNRYVQGVGQDATAQATLHRNRRWPTWMWANWEVVAFAEWLRRHNERHAGAPVSMHGLDVYSLWESLAAVHAYLSEHEPSAVPAAERAFRCFEPYREEGQLYSQALAFTPASCEEAVVKLLAELRALPPGEDGDDAAGARPDPLERFSAQQNALVARNAESYYRAMLRGSAESWNVRDRHMMETLERLFQHHGEGAKGIVWEHNTHVGDARYTDMADAGMVNVGQLGRTRFGNGALLVGFGSYQGSVIAGRNWDAPMESMRVPPAQPRSWEAEFHAAGAQDRLLLSDDVRTQPGFSASRGHRAIGVVYHPELESLGNYVPTILPDRYDAFVYLDETRALHPLHVQAEASGTPETYPWGL